MELDFSTMSSSELGAQKGPMSPVVDYSHISSDELLRSSGGELVSPSTGSVVSMDEYNAELGTPNDVVQSEDSMTTMPSTQPAFEPEMPKWEGAGTVDDPMRLKTSPEGLQKYIVMRGGAREEEALGVSPVAQDIFSAAGGEVALKGLGILASKIYDLYKYKGLPDHVVTALKTGDESTLQRIVQEAEQARDMGAGDLIYAGKGAKGLQPDDITTNLFEQRRFARKAQEVGTNAYEQAKQVVKTEAPLSETSQVLREGLESQYTPLKKAADDAYSQVFAKASDARDIDIRPLIEDIRDTMVREGAPDSEVSRVLSLLQPEGKSALATQGEKLAKQIESLEASLASAKTQSRRAILKRRIEDLKAAAGDAANYQNVEGFVSERDLINAVRGMNRSMRTDPRMPETADTARIMRMARDKLMKGVDDSPILQDLGEANRLAAQAYKFRDRLPEVSRLLNKGEVLPEEVTAQLLENPIRLTEVAKMAKSPKVKGNLAEQIVSRLARPIEDTAPGGLSRIDFVKTSAQLENLLGNKETRRFLKDALGDKRFQNLMGYRNITKKIGPLLKELDEVPGVAEYIKGGEGVTGTLGRSLKTVYDALGYMKNSALDKAGIKWGSSRVNVTTEQIEKVLDIATKTLKKGRKLNLPPEEIGKLMSLQEEQYLEQFSDYFNNLIEKAGNSAKAQAGTAKSNRMLGLGGGSVAGVETDEEGNIVGYDPAKGITGALAGAFLAGPQAIKFLKKFLPSKVDDFIKAESMASKGVNPQTIEKATGIPVVKGRAIYPTESIRKHMDLKQLQELHDVAGPKGVGTGYFDDMTTPYGKGIADLDSDPYRSISIDRWADDAGAEVTEDLDNITLFSNPSFKNGKLVEDQAVNSLSHELTHVGGFKGGTPEQFAGSAIGREVSDVAANEISRLTGGNSDEISRALLQRYLFADEPTKENTVKYIFNNPVLKKEYQKLLFSGNPKKASEFVTLVNDAHPVRLYESIEGEQFANAAGRLYGDKTMDRILESGNGIGTQIEQAIGKEWSDREIHKSLKNIVDKYTK